MRCKVIWVVAVALSWATTAHADYWVETFDNGPTGGLDQVWTAHDWGAAAELGTLQVLAISPATGGSDNSYYGIFGEDRASLPAGYEIYGSEDTGQLPPDSALQFASVDAVVFDDNGGHVYVEMRVNPAGVSQRNIAFITTNGVVNTIPGDLLNEQFYFLDLEPNPDDIDPNPWEADVGEFDPVNNPGLGYDPIESYGFAESHEFDDPPWAGPSQRLKGMEGQPWTGEYILGFWVIPNADQYASSRTGDDIIPTGATLLFGDIRQADGTVITQSSDDNGPNGISRDWDETGNDLPPGPVGIGFYNDGYLTLGGTYEDVTIDQIVAMTYYDGDFDTDGDVDGDDFLSWQVGYGTTVYASPRDGDADWDADVDGDDFLAWQANYGAVHAASGAGAVAGVPEPSGLMLLLFGVPSLLACTRRRS